MYLRNVKSVKWSSLSVFISWQILEHLSAFLPVLPARLLIYILVPYQVGLPGDSVGKESACSSGDAGNTGSIPESGRSPGGRAWQPATGFLPGESRGWRGLAGYSPQSCKELGMTEWLSMHQPNSKVGKQKWRVSLGDKTGGQRLGCRCKARQS